MREIEIVVLLNGNHLIIKTDESKKEELTALLGKCYKASFEDPAHFIRWGDATILSKSLIGWYFRTPIEPAAQQRIKFMEKKLPDKDEGDSWKNED